MKTPALTGLLKNTLTLADRFCGARAASAVIPTAGHVETTLDTARLEAYATSLSPLLLKNDQEVRRIRGDVG